MKNFIPNWLPEAFVGAVIGLLLPYIKHIIQYILSIFQDRYFYGTWYSYYFGFKDGNLVLREDVWLIDRGFKYRYHIVVTNIKKGLEYTGYLSEELDHYIAVLKAKTHKETVYIRFPLAVPTIEDRKFIGLSLARNSYGNPCSNLNILSQHRLTEMEVKTTFSRLGEIHSEDGLISIKPPTTINSNAIASGAKMNLPNKESNVQPKHQVITNKN